MWNSINRLLSGKGRTIFLFILLVLIILYLRPGILSGAILGNITPFTTNNEQDILLGMSIVEQDVTLILTDSQVPEIQPRDKPSIENPLKELTDIFQKNNWVTSFLLSSRAPSAQIYLDYIDLSRNANAPDLFCLRTIYLSKSTEIPAEIVIPNEIVSGDPLGNLTNTEKDFIYSFPSGICTRRGKISITPHLLLGVVPIDSYAELVRTHVGKTQASDYFPFDEQKMRIKIVIDGVFDGEIVEGYIPDMEIVVAEKGWTGELSNITEEVVELHLSRHPLFGVMLYVFIILMVATIFLLNIVIDNPISYFEVAFALLLGLWGMHEILVPNFIISSSIIDVVFYVLYILVITQIVLELVFQWTNRNRRENNNIQGEIEENNGENGNVQAEIEEVNST